MVILIFRRRQGRCIAMWYYVPVICSFLDARRFHLQLIIISKGKTIWFLLVVTTDERNGDHPLALLIWQKLLGQIKMWVEVSFRKFHLLNLNTTAFISYIAPFFQEPWCWRVGWTWVIYCDHIKPIDHIEHTDHINLCKQSTLGDATR